MKRGIKYLLIFSFIFLSLSFVNAGLFQKQEASCGDGTTYNNCSINIPYYCFEGKLVENASFCGCPEGFVARGNFCYSDYISNPKEINLKYILRGEENNISFIVYEEFLEYLSKIPRSIQYYNGNNFSRADFKLKAINEEIQREMLLPLVIKIQNIAPNKKDQARIAISIVQNIPYGASDKSSNFREYKIAYSRYPYEVLYEYEGICGEKTDLLLFLLRELGYGTGFFYYPNENHEAPGIKCPSGRSLGGSGYCFIETTAPSIISDYRINYVNIGRLSFEPEVYNISEGESLDIFLYEYSDVRKLNKIRNSIETSGLLTPWKKTVLENLKIKYGLSEEYYA